MKDEINAIDPPIRFKRFHNQMSIGSELFDEAQRLIQLGTNSADLEQLQAGVLKLLAAMDAGDKAVRTFERIIGSLET